MQHPEELPPPYTPSADFQPSQPRQQQPQQQQGSNQETGGKENTFLFYPQVPAASTSKSDLSVYSGGKPISFHVYKAAGAFCKDDIVTGDDKASIAYYLNFPTKIFSGSWDVSLHRGGKEGPLVANITKDTFSSNFGIRFANGWQTPLISTGAFSFSHEFVSFNGRDRYKWKSDGMLTTDLRCENVMTKQVVAHWRSCGFSISKDGQLLINAACGPERELFLVTALTMQEYMAERRRKRRS